MDGCGKQCAPLEGGCHARPQETAVVEEPDGRPTEARAWPDRTAGHDAGLWGDGNARCPEGPPDHLRDNVEILRKGPLPAELYAEAKRRLTAAGSAPVGLGDRCCAMSGITTRPRTKMTSRLNGHASTKSFW